MGAQLSPTAPYVQRFVLSVCGRIELAPGIYRRVSPVTGKPETHITAAGLARIRRRQPRMLHAAQDALAARQRIAPDPADRVLPEVATIMQRCAGCRRRQRRVRR